MQIAIISDIHGNMVGLEAALADIEARKIESIVCLGDIAASGPHPDQVVSRLRTLEVPVVLGNADVEMLKLREGIELETPRNEAMMRLREIDRWCANQLQDADIQYMRSFRPSIEVDAGKGAHLLAFHGSPRSNEDAITWSTSEEELTFLMKGLDASAVAVGHTHKQMLRKIGDITLFNPGSVGLPYEENQGQAKNLPQAEYAILQGGGDGLSVIFRRIPYELDVLTHSALSSGMPHARWWVENWKND